MQGGLSTTAAAATTTTVQGWAVDGHQGALCVVEACSWLWLDIGVGRRWVWLLVPEGRGMAAGRYTPTGAFLRARQVVTNSSTFATRSSCSARSRATTAPGQGVAKATRCQWHGPRLQQSGTRKRATRSLKEEEEDGHFSAPYDSAAVQRVIFPLLFFLGLLPVRAVLSRSSPDAPEQKLLAGPDRLERQAVALTADPRAGNLKGHEPA